MPAVSPVTRPSVRRATPTARGVPHSLAGSARRSRLAGQRRNDPGETLGELSAS